MATINTVTDEYVLVASINDTASTGVDSLTEKLTKFEPAANSAAAAAKAVGAAAGDTGERFSRASSQFDAFAKKYDDVTKAAAALAAAQRELEQAQTTGAVALQKGTATQEQYEATTAGLAEKINRLATALGAARAEAIESADAQAAWNGQIGASAASATAFAASVTNAAQITKAAQIAELASMDALSAAYGIQVGAVDAHTAAMQRAQAAIDKERASLDTLLASYDPIFAASLAYEQANDRITEAVTRAGLSEANADIARAKAAETYLGGAKGSDAYAASLDTLRAKFDPLFATSKRYEAQVNELNAAIAEGAFPTAASAEAAMDNLTAAYAKANDPLASVKKNTDDLTASNWQAKFATQQFGVQLVQFGTSVESGSPILLALIQQGHQLVDVALATGTGFEVIGNAAKAAWAGVSSFVIGNPVIVGIAALAAAVAVLSYTAETAARTQTALQAELSRTREDYVAMADSVKTAAKDIAATTTLTSAQATAAATTFAQIPGVAGPALLGLGQTLAGLARAMGDDIPAATKLMTDALHDPAKAALEMASAEKPMLAMSAAVLDTVTHMQQLGDRAGATKVVLAALGDTAKTATGPMTPLQDAFKNLDEAMNRTGENGKSFARELGEALNSAAAMAINAFASIIAAIKSARDAAANVQPATSGFEGWLQSTAWGKRALQSFAPGSPAAAATAAPTVSAAMQPIILNAANDNNLDSNLLARLHLNEGVYKDGAWQTSPTGPVGPMQVSPTTFAGMQAQPGTFPTVAGLTNLNDPAQNTQAGAALFAHLLNKYGDVKLAVLAYHDGETVIDQVLAGKGTPSQAALTEASQVTAGYSGTGYATGTSRQGRYAPTAGAAGYGPQVPTAADAEQNRLAIAGVGDQTAVLSGQKAVDDLTQKLKELGAARDAITHGATILTDEQTAQVARYDAAIAQTTINLKDAQDPTRAATLAMIDQANVAGIVGAADAALAAKQLEIARQRAQNPAFPESDQAAAAAMAALTADLAAGGEKLIRVNAQQVAQSAAIETGYKSSTAAGHEAALTQAAFNVAIEHYSTKAPDFIAQLNRIKESMRGVQEQAGSTAITQQNDAIDDATAATRRVAAAWDGSATSLTHLQDVEKANADALAHNLTPGTNTYKDAVDATTRSLDSAADAQRVMAQEQASVAAVSGAATQAFNTVGNAISQAFVQGQGAAVNWGNVMKAVISQVIQKIAELAILNPILNSLFSGQTNGTLGTAFSVLSNGSSSSGSSGGSSLSTGVSLLKTGKDIYSGIDGLVNGNSIGGISGTIDSYGASFAPSLFSTGVPDIAGASAAQISSATAANGLMSESAVVGQLGGSAAPVTGVGSIGSLSSFAGGIGVGAGLGSAIGGFEQSALGKTGPAPEIGAVSGAIAGAIIGSVVPIIGTFIGGVIGGVVGGAGGGLIGPQAKTIYSGIDLLVKDGQFAPGVEGQQKDDQRAATQVANLQNQITLQNQILAANGVQVEQLARVQIGDNSNKGAADPTKYADVNAANASGQTAFSQFRFTSNTDSILNDKLQNKAFNTTADLDNYLTQYQAVQAATKTFIANMAATMAALGTNIGSVQTQMGALAVSFNADKTNIDALLNSNDLSAQQVIDLTKAENDLTSVRDKGMQAIIDAAAAQDAANNASFAQRSLTAKATISGNPADALAAQLSAFDASAITQRAALKTQQIGLYGDGVTTMATYIQQVTGLESTLGQERLAIITTANNQILAAQVAAQTQYNSTTDSLNVRYVNAQAQITGTAADALTAKLYSFDTAAAAERAANIKSLTDSFGKYAFLQAGYWQQIELLDKTQAAERLAITTQADAQAKATALSAATAFITSLHAYVTQLSTSSQSPLSPGAKLAEAQKDFTLQSTKANAGDTTAMGLLQSSASTLLTNAQSYYGSASGYTAVFNQVIAELKTISDKSPDTLTASFLAATTQSQTTVLVNELQALRTQLVGLRADVARNSATPLRLVA